MRVLFVCAAGCVYGKELLTLTLMQDLRARGHSVMCINSSWGDPEFEKLLDKEQIANVSAPLGFISKTLTWPAFVMTLDQLRKLPSLWVRYRKTLKQFKPQVVVHSNFHHLLMLWPMLDGTNVFHVHDCFPDTRFYRRILKFLEKKVCLFVGVSGFVAASLRRLGVDKPRVTHVLNGIAAESTHGSFDNGRTKRALVIGIVGQVRQWKGHGDLIEALRLINDRKLRFVCRIFGDGDQAFIEELKSKIHSYGLEDQVEWIGFVEDRERIYSMIDLCVVPSKAFETFGMVAAEASIRGIPVIATKRGALPEVVIDELTGYLVDVGSAEQIADKLELVIQSEELRNKLGIAAKQHALRNLTSTRMSQQFEEVLASSL